MSTTPHNARPLKTKKTYLAKVVSVKYVEVSPYIYNKLQDDERGRYNNYRDTWLDNVINDSTISYDEHSLCYAQECGDHIWESTADEREEQLQMVLASGNYDCSCIRA